MFDPIDPTNEAAIVAGEDKPRRRGSGPDFSIRTVTHWFTLPQRINKTCTVESHEDNVPDDQDKTRERMIVEINGVNVCRWCYLAGVELDASGD